MILLDDIYVWIYENEAKGLYAWIFENRVSKDKYSFYYLAIKNNKIRPKADKKAYIWRREIKFMSLEAFPRVEV